MEGILWKDISGIKRISDITIVSLPLVGNLDLSGLSNLENLNCSNTMINSLNLEGVYNLKDLDCYKRVITSLDLIKINKLKNLYSYDSKITNLKLPKPADLEYLDCHNTNINNLDLTKLSNLILLDCSTTGISNLNLTQLSNLEVLNCSDTNITDLELTGLNNLIHLDYSNSKINPINLNSFSNLKELNCSETDITNLDLTGLDNLTHLDCFNTKINQLNLSNLSNLEYLYCYNTQISNLNLANLSNLKILYCDNCKLGLSKLKKIKNRYHNLFNESFLEQNILNKYIFTKGNIEEFGNKSSTYKWYINNNLISENLAPTYDLSNYIGKIARCEISDNDITLSSNLTRVIGLKFDNPPTDITQGQAIKLSVNLQTFDIDYIDNSVSWNVYNSSDSSISSDGILNVPLSETSKKITVRASLNFNNNEYTEININILKNGVLTIPQNLKWAEEKAVWEKVYNNSGYEIQLFKDNQLLKSATSNIEEYDFTDHFIDSGNYSFKVKAIGNNNYD